MRYRQLGTDGALVSELGFGASPLGGIYGTFAEEDGIAAVHAALDAGINFLDVSPYYGLTAAETVLGKALHGVDRDRYVLATKVGRYGDGVFDFSAARVTRSVRESMERLGVGHPLPALLHLARQVPVDTVMSYCHYTVQDRRLAARAAEFAAAGAALINASPLAMGALTDRGAPPWHPAPAQVLDRCTQAAVLCRERGSSLAKLALQFSVTTSPCVTTVVGSASPANAQRDVQWIGEPIDADLLADVDAFLEPVRDIGWVNGRPENQDPGRSS